MKLWNPASISKAETAQLVLIESLFGVRESAGVFFQGGTALRWCCGGSRFSEDLNFETTLEGADILLLLRKARTSMQKGFLANLGAGKLEIETEKCREELLCTVWTKFAPAGGRGKIQIKMEFQRIVSAACPDYERMIFSTLPSVAPRIANGIYQCVSPSAIIQVETPTEILAGKLRAIMERPWMKGRDFWDLWFLHHSLGVAPSYRLLRRKLAMYPFVLRRNPEELAQCRKQEALRETIIAAMEEDLQRFVHPDSLAALRREAFRPILETVQELFAGIPDAITSEDEQPAPSG